MKNKIFLFIVLITCTGLVFQSCSSSKKSDGSVDSQEQNQQELDEIEALLGITNDQSEETESQQTSKDEQLGFIESQDITDQGTVSQEEANKKDKEIKKLKNELKTKNTQISDLKAQVSMQQNRISAIEKEQAESFSSRSVEYSSVSVGDVSAEEYQLKYDEAFNLLSARQFEAAQQIFGSLIASNANHSLADNAQYWIGEIHYAQGKYDKAIMDFEKVFTFPKSNKNDYAQFKLGLCYLRKGETQKAKEEFQRFVDLYPKSELVGRAQQHIQSL